MKKLFVLVAVAALFATTSCKKTAEDYAKELLDLQVKYEKYEAEGDTDAAAKIKGEVMELYGEITKRAMEDPEFAQELLKVGNELESLGE